MSTAALLTLLAGGSAGAAVGRLLKLPMWPLTGALVGTAAVHLVVGGGTVFPPWCEFVAQVLVGSTVGARLGPTVFREFRTVIVPGTMVVLITVTVGVVLGLAMWATDGLELQEAVFSMIPGGVGEMVAAVASLEGDSALVAGMHLVRLFLVVTIMGALVRWFRRREQHRSGED